MAGKTVTDAVHGSISVEGVALDLLSSPELQRLNGIRQLGLTYLVFPGANHTRLEHVLGAHHVARAIVRALRLEEAEGALISTAALLHDLGHGPFSHTLERILSEATGLDHMEVTKRIIRGEQDSVPDWERTALPETPSVAEILDAWDMPRSEVADLVTGRDAAGGLFAFEGNGAAEGSPYPYQIIHGALDADQIDFLLRDAFYTGVAHGIIDLPRLLGTFRLADGNLAVDRKGLSAVEGTLVARGLMYTSVYFHKTVRIAETMLARAVEMAASPEEVFLMNDAELMAWLLAQEGHPRETALRVKYRRLYKRVLTRETNGLASEERERLVELAVPEKRRQTEDAIGRRVGLPPGKVIVDIPAPEILLTEPRISLVDLLVVDNGKVQPFRKVSPLARALRVREAVDWAVMVASDPAHVDEVRRVAPKVIFG
ncbi:MAG: HD domain-containing protein [Thermoplasmata archaeon]|nr:HD domain-containing protein [Thermoplasmata archaeon]